MTHVRLTALPLVLAALALVATPAMAQVPDATAKVGEPFEWSGIVYGHPTSGRDAPFYVSDRNHDQCSLENGVILWEPGISTPGGVSLLAVQGGWNVHASGGHTFQRRIAVGAVDFTLICAGNAQRHTYRDWVDITVTGEPAACPTGTVATVSQASCPNTYFGSDEKFLFRKLAKIAHDGLVVDQTLDEVFSAPEDYVKEILGVKDATGVKGTIAEWLVGKAWGKIFDRLIDRLPKRIGRFDWILDTPKYAAYLDLAKYTVLTRLANDPPDPEFQELAKPPPLRSLPEARSASARDRREIGLYIALLTAVERADGARLAGNAAAEGAQLRHASQLANQLVSLLGAEEKALEEAARTASRIRAAALPRKFVVRAKRTLGSRAFEASAGRALRALGFTDRELREVADGAPAVDVGRFTRPFAKVIDLDAQAKLVRAERAALARFANRHALAGG